jgi:N-acetylmuramoyl-L-alanine amidase
VHITQRLIPEKLKDTRPGIPMTPKFITIHETDNTGLKANAEAHARLQESGNSRQASWHLQVDEQYAIQSIPFNEIAWAAGDGGNGPGNRTSIHLEICVNKDGDYKKAVHNAAEVTKQLMKQFHIPLDHVVQHNHWSGKNCPSIMRSGKSGITWEDFLNLLKEQPKEDNSYTIQKGDNFWKLETKLKLKHGTLQVLNPKVYVDKLQVGQKIRVK